MILFCSSFCRLEPQDLPQLRLFAPAQLEILARQHRHQPLQIKFLALSLCQYVSGRIRRLKRTVPFTFRRLEGGLEGGGSRGASSPSQGGFKGSWRGLHLCEAFKGLGFKGAWEGLQGSFKGASRGLEKGLRRASRGLENGLRRAVWRWRLRRGLQGAWEGLQGGFKVHGEGASRRLGGGFKEVWARFERCLRKAWSGLRSFWEGCVITCASNRSLAPPILTCAPQPTLYLNFPPFAFHNAMVSNLTLYLKIPSPLPSTMPWSKIVFFI